MQNLDDSTIRKRGITSHDRKLIDHYYKDLMTSLFAVPTDGKEKFNANVYALEKLFDEKVKINHDYNKALFLDNVK